jgi:short-subunit dehydrogenase
MGVVLVTGASGGIGEGLARCAAADGHEVVLVARRADRLAALAEELGGPGRARVLVEDLTSPGAAERVAGAVPAPDVLVNNAGFGTFGPLHRTDVARTMGMVELNVGVLTELTARLLPSMVERGSGRVLNVASTAAFFPGPLMAVYYATKAYVLSLSEALAEELRGTGVTVTALCPGPTASGFQAGAAMESSALVKGRRMPSSAEVARFGWAATMKGDVVAVHGLANKVQVQAGRVTPRAVTRRVVKRVQRET